MCTISIDAIGGVGVGPSSISVLGTAADCEVFEGGSVRVRLSCGTEDNTIGEQTVSPDPAGNWHASFAVTGECACGGEVFVIATCVSDPTCTASKSESLTCVDCPIFRNPGDDVGSPAVSVVCNPDGTANVTITQHVTNPGSSLITVVTECGPDGVLVSGGSTGVFPGQTVIVSATCRYPTPHTPLPVRMVVRAGPPSFELLGCPPREIALPILPECEVRCPRILNVAVQIGECVRSDEDGIERREVTFTPSISGAHGGRLWVFGDGSTPDFQSVPAETTQHKYAAKPINPPYLCIYGPDDCEDCYQIPLSAFDAFEACACPVIMDIQVEIGECVVDPNDGLLKREVTFTPTVSPPNPTSHVWTFGDGSTPVSGGTGPVGQRSHRYLAAPTTEPQLCIDGPEPCGQRCTTVPLTEFAAFEPCGEGSTPPAGDEGLGCAALRWLAAIFGALGLLALMLALCLPAASTILGITAAVSTAISAALVALYWVFCPDKQCGWLLLLSAQILLGAGASAIVLSGCCGWMLWAGIALLAAGLALIAAWWADCKKSLCDVTREITVPIMGLAVPILGVIASVPGVSACVSTAGLGWIGAIFGPIAAYAAACQLDSSNP